MKPMDRLEIMKRALVYSEQLANGFDPITGEELPNDTVLNNVRLSRYFFFVKDVLREVIENGGEVTKATKMSRRMPFRITEEEKARVELSDEPVQISKFNDKINEQVNPEESGKLKVTAFGEWLVSKGFMAVEIRGDKKYKKATASGEQIGIISEWRQYGDREYFAVTYNREAQQFLLDNLDDIAGVSNGAAE